MVLSVSDNAFLYCIWVGQCSDCLPVMPSFATNYLSRGECQRANAQLLMMQPYGRIVVLYLTIIFGGMLMMSLKSPVWGLLLLVALKITLDLRAHLKERRKFSAKPITTK